MADMRTPKKPIIISYRDLSHCKKPEYLPEYSAHCWGECKPDLSCSSPPTAEDISAKRLVQYYGIWGVNKFNSDT